MMDMIQRGLASTSYKFFVKKSASLTGKSAEGGSIKNMLNEKLAEELHRPIIRKFEKHQVYTSFKGNI